MIILSEEPIAQDIEIDGIKYYWSRSYTDLENTPNYVNVFITIHGSDTITKKEREMRYLLIHLIKGERLMCGQCNKIIEGNIPSTTAYVELVNDGFLGYALCEDCYKPRVD